MTLPYVICMHMIELRHLRYAVAVADAGHITRAAEQLGIQQPPLSQQIRALETMIGTPLFHRLPRGMALTAAGQTLVERARIILADVDLAVEATQRSARGEQGNLAIGFTSSAAFHPLVSSMVRSLKQSAPDVALALEEASTGDLIEALRAERLDVAFVRSPVDASAGLVIEPILDEEMLVALPDQHPLATGQSHAAGTAYPRGASRFLISQTRLSFSTVDRQVLGYTTASSRHAARPVSARGSGRRRRACYRH